MQRFFFNQNKFQYKQLSINNISRPKKKQKKKQTDLCRFMEIIQYHYDIHRNTFKQTSLKI